MVFQLRTPARGKSMHAVVRSYSGQGAEQLFDFLEEKKAGVEKVIRGVPSLRSYTLMRTADGGVSVTVCDDKAGADASVEIVGAWIRANAGQIGAAPAKVADGTAILQLH
jgi:hypothetical protein